MRLVVAIPTFGRAAQLARLVDHLAGQTRPPDAVIVSAPDAGHIALPDRPAFPVRLVFGPAGSSHQRNAALDAIADDADIVTFFDDDFVPAADYLERIERAFVAHDDVVVAMGDVILDGAHGAGVSWEEALAAIAAAGPVAGTALIDHVGAYGCNMSIRVPRIEGLRFDERLVLYGWQEDIDFTSQLRRRGRVVCVRAIRGVHLGIKTGRVSGLRFGYSQVVNPIYLIRKGSVPASFALPLLARNLAANVLRSVRPEPWVDRRGRLRGNLRAIAHVLRGRVEPEHVLKL